jgi:hypothetical protein
LKLENCIRQVISDSLALDFTTKREMAEILEGVRERPEIGAPGKIEYDWPG